MISLGKIKTKFCSSNELKASTAYMFCSVLQRCLSIITLPLFTRLLTKEEYGISTVYSSTMAIMLILVSLNLPYGSFSTAMMKFEKDRYGYISSVCMICTFLTAIYFIVLFCFKDYWCDLLGLPTIILVIMGFEMLMSTAQQLWMGKARFEYDYKPIVFVTLASSIFATLGSLAAALFLSNKGVNKVLAHGIIISLFGLVLFINNLIKGKTWFNKEYWKYALSFNIPLIPYYLSQIIFNQSDRLMINKMTGKSDAAMYGVAYTLAFILTFVLNAINNSFVPWMYKKIKENKLQENKNISIIIAGIMAVLLLGVIALAPEIIIIMAGEQYTPAIWVVPPVAMSLLLLFYSQLFINVEFYFEEKYKLVGASILAAVVNIVLNYFGIKMFGFVAAGYTTLISYILFASCNFLAMKRVCREKGIEGNLYDYKMLAGLFIAFSAVGFIFTALYPFRWVRLGFIVVAIVVILFFKNKFVDLFKKVKSTFKT